MIQVSEAYKKIVKSCVRPKCEPIIKISAKDNNGNNIDLEWKADNITRLNYKHGIDPVGRELPYMELTWTEVYTGKLNSQNYPEKYNNVAKYMPVKLSFVQDLGFFSTWSAIFKSGLTWKDIFSKETSWKKIKQQVSQETITLPTLYLNAKPTIKGQTITWEAVDMLNFATGTQAAQFSSSVNRTFKNIMMFFILNARGDFLKAPYLLSSYTDTATHLSEEELFEDCLTNPMIVDDFGKNIILNLANIYSYYLTFKDNIFVLNFSLPTNTDSVFNYEAKQLYSFPEITFSPDISNYSFKYHLLQSYEDKAYTMSPTRIEEHGNNTYTLMYDLSEYGEAYRLNGETPMEGHFTSVSPKFAYNLGSYYEGENKEAYVVPRSYNEYTAKIVVNKTGETFEEDNPINPYDQTSDVSKKRKSFLENYFSSNVVDLSFEALPNISIEPNDVIEVETNLYDDSGNRIKKKALVVYVEFDYNGVVKQKIKAHEVTI